MDSIFNKETRYIFIPIINILQITFSKNLVISTKKLYNIYLLYMISNYRGWRHNNGLPTRGQRTWSNGWTCFKNNFILKNLLFKFAKEYYYNLDGVDIKLSQAAEDVNQLWRVQWNREWYSARRRWKIDVSQKVRNLKVDLYAMSKGFMNIPKPVHINKKKEKYYRVFTQLVLIKVLQKNYYCIYDNNNILA